MRFKLLTPAFLGTSSVDPGEGAAFSENKWYQILRGVTVQPSMGQGAECVDTCARVCVCVCE